MMLHGLAPLCDARTEVLVLGSFPGVASLVAQQYYGHPRNHFWRLLGELLGEPLHELDYAQRTQRALAHGIGIWDVIGACERTGSLDSAIRNEQPNDFAALFARCPRIGRVALNGARAGRYRGVIEAFDKPVQVLPSTSPANATWSFERKRAAWAAFLAPSL